MSEPLSQPPPDLGAYVDLRPFDPPDQELIDAMISHYGILNPGWIAREGNTEVLLMETLALGTAEAAVAVNRLPGAVVEAILHMANVDRDYGAPATCQATVTLADGLGYTIPTGTRFYLTLPTSTVVFLLEPPDVQIASGQTSATLNLISNTNTAAGNGVEPGTRLLLADQLHMVHTVELTTVVTGGRDPETTEVWRDRGVARFRRFSDALVVPRHFDAALDEDPRVGRVLTIDLWDGSVVTPGVPGDNPGHVTVAVIGPDGFELPAADLTALETTVEGQAAAMLDVHVVNAVIDELTIAATVNTAADYDQATVLAAAELRIREYLDPLTWPASEPVRHYELISELDRVPGVNYVVSVTINAAAADYTLSGPRALPRAATNGVTITAGT